jgi:hypothetical protein
MGPSNNTFNTTPKNMSRLDKKIVFNVLIIAAILVCVSLVTLRQELINKTEKHRRKHNDTSQSDRFFAFKVVPSG